MSGGDYALYKQTGFPFDTDVNLAVGDAGKAAVITARSAGHAIYVQKISYNPVTAAAQAITIQDSAGTPVVIGTVPASQSTPIVFDYGPKGVKLTVGKNLDLSNTAGPAAKIHIEAYQRLDTPAAAGTNN